MTALKKCLPALFLVTLLPTLVTATNDVNVELVRQLERTRRHFGLNRAIGVMVQNVETGEILYAHNADKRFIPASGMKLVVIAASLHYLGPNFRFETRFLVDGPVEKGVIKGNVFVQGSGDPSLTRQDMDYITDQIAAAGIKEIQGNLILDDSFFDDQLRGPASYEDILKQRLPIQSALSYNYNLVELRATPGSPGAPAHLIDEGYGYFEILNRVTTATKGNPWVRVQKLRHDRVLIRGRVVPPNSSDPGEPVTEQVGRFVSPNPTRYFGSAFLGKLRAKGVLFSGEMVKGTVEGRKLEPLYLHRSARLVEVVEAMGKYSNNFSAEQMLKALGAYRWGAPGSFESGGRAVSEYLVGLGFDRKEFRIEDGSGLSYENGLTAEIMTRVLSEIFRAPELRTEVICSLSIGGVDGTLRRRFLNADHMGRIMAKTGSLAGVSSLSGYAISPTRGPLVFSVLTNGIRGQYRADHVEDEIARVLLEY